MGKVGALVCCFIAAACGRVGFGPIDKSVTGDATGGGDDDDSGGDGGTFVTPPSCLGMAAICGPSGTSPCCGSPVVQGGTFFRSYDVGGDGGFSNMTFPATVGDFRLDTYEVTVARFRQFVNAGFGTVQNPPPAGAGARTLNGSPNQAGWDSADNFNLVTDTATLVTALKCGTTAEHTWTDSPAGNEALPINCIDWWEATAFCLWDGGFLPTEAEWNYAAAGGSEQRAYPWSSPASSLTIDCSYANAFDYNLLKNCVNPPNGATNRVGSESPKGDGRWGQADLAGNVWEWVLDDDTSYSNPCDNCASLSTPGPKELRGEPYYDDTTPRTGQRSGATPTIRDWGYGVRCARRP